MSRRVQLIVLGIALAVGVGLGAAISVTRSDGPSATPTIPAVTPVQSPQLDPGAPVNAVAPAFTLTDQFGKRVSLRSLRGKVVVLSFNDPVCTTICPLTTTALLHAKALLGPAGANVELVGVGANPEATQVKWVRAYSKAHGMLHEWRFLTGSLPELRRVWRAYGIEAAVINGAIDHTPATYVIDRRGRESRLYLTQMAYSSVDQLGYEIAQSISALLPGHPHVRGSQSPEPLGVLGPKSRVSLPRAGRSGSVRLGPGSGPHLVLFFDTWETEVADLRALMQGIDGYAKAARRDGLPPLVAVDEEKVEPSPRALTGFLRSLPHPLSYPVVVDASGRVADGYRVQDSPWLTLVSGSGRFLFFQDLADGWPKPPQLLAKVRAALARGKR
ncbi:MAG TPA: redoxin domain-containing protein [Gaiellaceae bacterium]|nr:redoxin domain-containing protein [Gaiellaceae bacterium]